MAYPRIDFPAEQPDWLKLHLQHFDWLTAYSASMIKRGAHYFIFFSGADQFSMVCKMFS
jgi:hypothetical protein